MAKTPRRPPSDHGEKDPANPRRNSAPSRRPRRFWRIERTMNSKELIDAMAAKKLWTSPGGKTPAPTLYSAITREISTKGKDSRFRKAEKRQVRRQEVGLGCPQRPTFATSGRFFVGGHN